MNADQSFLKRAKDQIFGFQRRRAVERAREKNEKQLNDAELKLFLDTAHAEGYDPENNPAPRREFRVQGVRG